ncbi:MAG: type I secretion C-terminal target domain-containing protein, partial [Burkholderiaceae bacterium]
ADTANSLATGATVTDVFTYTVKDPGNQVSNTTTLTITVTGVNDAPAGTNATITMLEDASRTLVAADFGFSDIDGNAFNRVEITTLPGAGSLTLSGVAVTAGQFVTAAQLAANQLVYKPAADASGSGYANFTFQVEDNGGTANGGINLDQSPSTLTFNVTPVADQPTLSAWAKAWINALDDFQDNNVNVGQLTWTSSDAAVETNFQSTYNGVQDPTAGTPVPGSNIVMEPEGTADAANWVQTTINADTAGQVIQISFDAIRRTLSGTADRDLQSFSVVWNGAPIAAYDTSAAAWVSPVLTVTSVAGINTLRFVPTDQTGSIGSIIDNVSIKTIADGLEDTPINLPSLAGHAVFGDIPDNSEQHTLSLTGIPVGATISDGIAGHTFTATLGNTSVVVFNEDNPAAVVGGANWTLSSLRITPPANFNGTFTLGATATAVEIANGDTASANTTLDVIVAAVNDAPLVGTGQATVSEEGLTGANPDTTGNTDTTNATVSSGTIAVSDIEGSPLTVTLTAPATALTHHGVALTWSGTGTAADPLIGSASGTEIVRATINNSGAYTVTLSGSLDHPVSGVEDVLSFNVGVSVSDGSLTSTGTLTVNVEDDMPVTSSIVVSNSAPQVNTNLMVVLDISGSMGDASGVTGLTRLQASVAGIKEMIEQYDSMGDVMVNISTFASTGTAGTWMTASNAVAFLNSLAPTSGTDYDAALAAAQTAFGNAGKIAGAQNQLYFLSDGVPNEDNGTGSIGIVGPEITAWQNFLDTNLINAFAIGMGAGATTSTMDPVAYNGIQHQDANAIVVTDMGQFATTLTSLVQSTYTGNLLNTGSAVAGSLGADGGYISVVTYGNNTFTYDGTNVTRSGAGSTAFSFNSTTHALTLTTSSGSFSIDLDNGDYNYATSPGIAIPHEVVGFTLRDSDGDTSSNSLTLNFTPTVPAPIAREDNVLVASGSVSANSVTIKDSWLLWNDSDFNNSSLSITAVANATSHSGGQVVDAVTSNSGGTGSFDYTDTAANPSAQTDSAHVSITTINSSTLTGDGLDNIIIGDGSNETINGNEGNDVLVGNAGADTLNGGTGNDLLIGGTGNDIIDGGAGIDTVSYEDGTSAVVVNLNTGTSSGGGLGTDTISNVENVIGSSFNDTLTGNALSNVLIGGAGNDTLTGGAGADVFQWRLGDQGSVGAPASDTVTDFNSASFAAGGDALNLRDLLQGENHLGTDPGNLSNYLHFSVSGGTTTVHISHTGAFSGGFNAANDTQTITLTGVDLVGGLASDAAVIANLLNNGKLITD